ncbi:hypothetical protein B5E56_12925 [Flavonifractor sp. An112]|uniref:hypothetical protein n=1 Tax=Flavonifractor sp. An112 TaxID=1965544 RepID=UPI000B37A108|nr:hypothetical protein [Flavonifractor sp. An112]OUQ56378.1 hypothetical protein B5E56_12925 [Flavonifractor sp. An112]
MSSTYRGLTKIAWGYVFLHLNLNLGTLNVLPNWVGYLLFFFAITLLGDQLRDLTLLKPFCILLGARELADWLAVFATGQTLMGQFFLLNALLTCIGLYFHFQMLTDLALLAEAAGESGGGLRTCRNVDAVLRTLMFLPLPWEEWDTLGTLILMGVLVVWIIVMFCIIWQLFRLRKKFA